MIFAFPDDGTLWILEGEADAQRQFEGIDVESGVVHFYDESGTYLEPRFSVPNRTGKWLGILSWVESGAFHLVPNPSAVLSTLLARRAGNTISHSGSASCWPA